MGVCTAFGASDPTTEKADQRFQKGLDAYNARKWSEAVGLFRESYGLVGHSMTSYCISCCYNQLADAEKALEFAKKTLADKPALQDPYLSGAREIRAYAEYVLDEKKKDPDFIGYTISVKADYAGPQVPNPSLPPTISSQAPAPRDASLTGIWRSDHNGTYFIRQVDNTVWWYAESSDNGKQWAHVFHGTKTGNRIRGTWADVPKGLLNNSGALELELEASGRLVRRTGEFGDTSWTRVPPAVRRDPSAGPAKGASGRRRAPPARTDQ